MGFVFRLDTDYRYGRRVVSVAFKQAPEHPVDKLVVRAARPDGREPSRVLAVAARRTPELKIPGRPPEAHSCVDIVSHVGKNT